MANTQDSKCNEPKEEPKVQETPKATIVYLPSVKSKSSSKGTADSYQQFQRLLSMTVSGGQGWQLK